MKNQPPKKSLGQHWLNDTETLESIVKEADISKEDFVLEIGPGQGSLTELLVALAGEVLALEFDEDLIESLNDKFKNQRSSNLKVVHGDIRQFDFSKLPQNYKIVANIPYYLTSNLIRSISQAENLPKVTVLLVQKEVAERICAGVGQMSILSVVAQFYFECNLGIIVPAEQFTPPPKVDSRVVVLKRRSNKMFDVADEKFFQIIKAGFLERRKKLRSSLSRGLSISKEEVENWCKRAKVDPDKRAQALSLEDWYSLYLEK